MNGRKNHQKDSFYFNRAKNGKSRGDVSSPSSSDMEEEIMQRIRMRSKFFSPSVKQLPVQKNEDSHAIMSSSSGLKYSAGPALGATRRGQASPTNSDNESFKMKNYRRSRPNINHILNSIVDSRSKGIIAGQNNKGNELARNKKKIAADRSSSKSTTSHKNVANTNSSVRSTSNYSKNSKTHKQEAKKYENACPHSPDLFEEDDLSDCSTLSDYPNAEPRNNNDFKLFDDFNGIYQPKNTRRNSEKYLLASQFVNKSPIRNPNYVWMEPCKSVEYNLSQCSTILAENDNATQGNTNDDIENDDIVNNENNSEGNSFDISLKISGIKLNDRKDDYVKVKSYDSLNLKVPPIYHPLNSQINRNGTRKDLSNFSPDLKLPSPLLIFDCKNDEVHEATALSSNLFETDTNNDHRQRQQYFVPSVSSKNSSFSMTHPNPSGLLSNYSSEYVKRDKKIKFMPKQKQKTRAINTEIEIRLFLEKFTTSFLDLEETLKDIIKMLD